MDYSVHCKSSHKPFQIILQPEMPCELMKAQQCWLTLAAAQLAFLASLLLKLVIQNPPFSPSPRLSLRPLKLECVVQWMLTGVRLMEVRTAYCREDFEWDNTKIVAVREMDKANQRILSQQAEASFLLSMEGKDASKDQPDKSKQ